jgi:hypothetical protein
MSTVRPVMIQKRPVANLVPRSDDSVPASVVDEVAHGAGKDELRAAAAREDWAHGEWGGKSQ